LVLDMDRSPNWQALCEFLDKPIPDVPYPQAFVTRSLKNRRTGR
jgi:hypothetical protein